MLNAVVQMDFKQQDKLAAEWLLQYHERKKEYQRRQAENCMLSAVRYNGLPHGNGVGRPTETKGLLVVEMEKIQAWLQTIENAESTLSEKKQAFLDFRRRAEHLDFTREVGRPGWVDYVQVKYADWHERNYDTDYLPSKKTLHLWWNEIVNVTVRIAIARGCL